MVDIKVSGRKIAVTDSLRDYVDEKIGNALKVFDIKPMTCDVVLRVNKNPSNPDRKYVEVTVFVRDNVVRVVTSDALEQMIAMGHGAMRISSREFLEELEKTRREIAARIDKDDKG